MSLCFIFYNSLEYFVVIMYNGKNLLINNFAESFHDCMKHKSFMSLNEKIKKTCSLISVRKSILFF
jgi:hypothetical protein